jgi:hypothetical protein
MNFDRCFKAVAIDFCVREDRLKNPFEVLFGKECRRPAAQVNPAEAVQSAPARDQDKDSIPSKSDST